jgi:hypothetical protein
VITPKFEVQPLAGCSTAIAAATAAAHHTAILISQMLSNQAVHSQMEILKS